MALPIKTFHALRHINVLCIFRSLLLLLVWQGVRHPYGTLDTGHTRIELRATNLIAAMHSPYDMFLGSSLEAMCSGRSLDLGR